MNAHFRPPRREPGPDPRQTIEWLIAYYEDVKRRTDRSVRLFKFLLIWNSCLLAMIIYLQL